MFLKTTACKYILLFFLYLFSINLAVAQSEPPLMPVQFTYKDFNFVPGKTCESTWIDNSFCAATGPKPWRSEEANLMIDYLTPLYSGRLDAFVRNILNKGFHSIHRYSHGFKPVGNGKYTREEYAAWVWIYDNSINISDLALVPNLPKDPIGGFELQKVAILHEFSHAFSSNEIELMDEFYKLTGWSKHGDAYVLANTDIREVYKIISQSHSLMLAGQIEEAIKLNRNYGIKHGFPTAYAMVNPGECFAEIASHVFFDSRIHEYLKPEIIDWAQKRVLR